MLKHVIEDLDDDSAIYICYHLDSNLLDLRRLHAHSKTLEQLFSHLLFTDDVALIAHPDRVLQCLTSCFAEAAQLFGLVVSLKKTEILLQWLMYHKTQLNPTQPNYIYLIYMYKQDLVLNNLQGLICCKTQPNQTNDSCIQYYIHFYCLFFVIYCKGCNKIYMY